MNFNIERRISIIKWYYPAREGRSGKTAAVKARTDYANRACNVTCNVMLVAKLVPRTADEPSTQRTAILCPLMIDCTLFYRHSDECLHFITFAISLILEELIIPTTVYNNY
jgi:hypothetical protein